MRKERIEKLLRELEYEITRGIMNGEIEEEMTFRFIVPVSSHIKNGVVLCEFRVRPTHHAAVFTKPTLHLVAKNE